MNEQGEENNQLGPGYGPDGNLLKDKAPESPDTAPDLKEKKPIPEIVISQEKYDGQKRLIHEHKAGYADLAAKEEGRPKYVNDNHYSYIGDTKRKESATMTGFTNEKDFEEGKMQWGHRTDFTYDDENNKVIGEGHNIDGKEGVWHEETEYGPDGFKFKKTVTTTEGPKKGEICEMVYEHHPGKVVSPDGKEYEGIIETENGTKKSPDGTEATWQKIIVYNENHDHLDHWPVK